jgi:DNA polymerase III subunit delta
MLDTIKKITDEMKLGKIYPIYLISGDDEFLVSKMKSLLIDLLLPGEKKIYNLEVIPDDDAGFEDKLINALSSISIFKEKIVVLARYPIKASKKLNMLENFLSDKLDFKPKHTLVFISDEGIDKRSNLYKIIDKKGIVIDLPAVKDRRKWTPEVEKTVLQMIEQKVKEYGKKLKGDSYKLLMERSGNDLRTVFCELEKLCLYLGSRVDITKKDILEITDESSEMAFYAIGEALGNRDASAFLSTLDNFFKRSKSPSYILQLIFDYLQDLKCIKDILRSPAGNGYKSGLDYRAFSFNYLSKLLDAKKNGSVKSSSLLGILSWKPYRIFKLFEQSDRFDENEIDELIIKLKEIDIKIKSSSLSSENMIYSLAFSLGSDK